MRKTAKVTIDAAGRDKGKVFILTEMPVSRIEKWATRAILALAKAGVEVPDMGGGLASIAAAGIMSLAKLSFDDAEPLMDEMMTCVTIMPDPKRPSVTRTLVEDDIEELGTRIRLRTEVLNLHMGFSVADFLSARVETMPAN